MSNLWIREMQFMNAGDVMSGHKHTFDHATLCATGSFEVTLGDEIHVIDETPCVVFIAKDIEHKIVALENNSLAYCLHGIHDPEEMGNIMNPAMMPQFGGDLKIPLTHDDKDLVRVK